jgi:hypothetical protein
MKKIEEDLNPELMLTLAPDHIKVNTFGKPYLPTLLAMKLD